MISRHRRSRTPKLCRNYTLGYCPQGQSCKYLHVIVPTASASQPAAAPVQPQPPATQFSFPVAHWFQQNPDVQRYNPAQQTWAAPPSAPTYSTSVSFPPPNAPQYRPLSWRTALCRHFSRNRGWCPLGDECNYIHDLELADIALEDGRFPDGLPPAGGSRRDGPPVAGSKRSHCWAYIQGLCHVENCPYLHPVQAHLFIKHTPCLQWPNCTKGALCPYKHPEPIIPKVPTLPASGSIESPPSVQPPSPVESTLSGAVQYQGTTYFPLRSHFSLSPPAPPAQVPSVHVYEPTTTTEVAVPMGYGPYLRTPSWQPQISPVSPPVRYTPGFALEVAASQLPPPAPLGYSLQSGSPAGPVPGDHPMYSANPPVPLPPPFQYPTQQAHRRDPSIPRTTVPVPPAIMEQFTSLGVPAEEEFPYVAPQVQRAGHARRVSVALRSKEDTDALGLFASAPAREAWQTHGSRSTHKSWAPASSKMAF